MNTRVEISSTDERPNLPGPEATFTGRVRVKTLFDPCEGRDTAAAEVTFSPCARTAWHTHPGGQTLIVTGGNGWVQEWGAEKRRITEGDVVWTPPDVKHWHGAEREKPMTHIAIQREVGGRLVDWMEQVDDDVYLTPPAGP